LSLCRRAPQAWHLQRVTTNHHTHHRTSSSHVIIARHATCDQTAPLAPSMAATPPTLSRNCLAKLLQKYRVGSARRTAGVGGDFAAALRQGPDLQRDFLRRLKRAAVAELQLACAECYTFSLREEDFSWPVDLCRLYLRRVLHFFTAGRGHARVDEHGSDLGVVRHVESGQAHVVAHVDGGAC
jgi:hypothetical protein